MIERLTDRTRKVLRLATQEADALDHQYVGTEHILLGLIVEPHGIAGNVLRNLGLSPEAIRAETMRFLGAGDKADSDPEHAQKLNEIIRLLHAILKQEHTMAATIDDILSGVQEESTIEDSVLALLKNVQGQVADPAKVQAVIDALAANKSKLNAVLTANTPAAPPAPGDPAPAAPAAPPADTTTGGTGADAPPVTA